MSKNTKKSSSYISILAYVRTHESGKITYKAINQIKKLGPNTFDVVAISIRMINLDVNE